MFFVDDKTLNHSWRCCQEICDYASKIASEYLKMNSKNTEQVQTKGIFLIRPDDRDTFLRSYSDIVQLRWDKRTKGIIEDLKCKNFGESKGLTFDGVLIYPTKVTKKEKLPWLFEIMFLIKMVRLQ